MTVENVEVVFEGKVYLAKRWVEYFLDVDTGNRIPVNRHGDFKKTKKRYWVYN